VVPRDPWRSGPDLPQRRFDHTATAFEDKIVLAGRPSGQDAPFVIEYDPTTDQWSNCGPSGCAQPEATSLRKFHTAVRVDDRMILLGGCIGYGGACSYGSIGYKPIEYDRSENRWSNCGDQGCADTTVTRGDIHHVAEAIGGKVYVTGGRRDEERIAVEEYDPLTNVWTNCGAAPGQTACEDGPRALRRRVISSQVINGEMHVLAGESWDFSADPEIRADHLVYHPSINEWRSWPDFPAAHAYMVGAIDGVPYAIGGTSPDGWSEGVMHRWDGTRWVRGTAPVPFWPGDPDSARTVWNGEAYFFGGSRSIEVVIYNPLYDW
jgi:N-acetylneuraminic acid mutarotase